ncbi:MAG: NADH-quinone oxidoreductase subunit C [Spirochaetales bacterium]
MNQVSFESFRSLLAEGLHKGGRIAGLWAIPIDPEKYTLYGLTLLPEEKTYHLFSTSTGKTYPSLTIAYPAVHWFERDLAERYGLIPEGHPFLKPIRFYKGDVGITDFFRLKGEEVHEVAVGPVHAGIIEPGHFRFQCVGETVYHLEISLGYQHRGIERALEGGPNPRTIHYMETLAGDTTLGHTWAYAQVVESLMEVQPSPYAELIRAVALELERLANHIGDIGALAGDVGFLPTQSYCGRIRGDVLNLTALICGNRFGRGLIRPGGVRFSLEPDRLKILREKLKQVEKDTRVAVELLFETPSARVRLEETGKVPTEIAREIGLVGVAARASGLAVDTRKDLPWGIYKNRNIPLVVHSAGDCYARASVRWQEIQASLKFLLEITQEFSDGALKLESLPTLKPDSYAVGITEGWRGEIVHVAKTDDKGKLAWYRVFDPSFHNWFGLAYAMQSGQISDFPLCNKSFNLSYCGHDL